MAKRKRYIAYSAIAIVMLTVIVWNYLWYRWRPEFSYETAHYVIHSTATREQAEELGQAAEALYAAYDEFFHELLPPQEERHKLQAKLFKDRYEFRVCNRIEGWAEAFYRKPYSYQYYSAGELNPFHWMLHETTHQLNAEIAGFELAQWLEEGIASYFSTSQLRGDELIPGMIDRNTYPVWHLMRLAQKGDLEQDLAAGHVIPLRAIITGEGGPELDTHFNLYYLHWLTLAHFLFHYHEGVYRAGAFELIEAGGNLDNFETLIGPLERIQAEWHEHVLELKNPASEFFDN